MQGGFGYYRYGFGNQVYKKELTKEEKYLEKINEIEAQLKDNEAELNDLKIQLDKFSQPNGNIDQQTHYIKGNNKDELMQIFNNLPQVDNDFDDCLMEINQETFDKIFLEYSKYTVSDISFLNYFLKIISIGKFINLADEKDIKSSLNNILTYINNKKDFFSLLHNYQNLLQQILTNEVDVKFIGLIDREKLKSTNIYLVYLFDYLKCLIITKFKDQIQINPNLAELKNKILVLYQRSKECQEELRRNVLFLKELRENNN